MCEMWFVNFVVFYEDGICYIGEGFCNKNEYVDELCKYQKLGKLLDFEIQYVVWLFKEIDEFYKGCFCDMKCVISESCIGSGKWWFFMFIDQVVKVCVSDICFFVYDSFIDPGFKIVDCEVKVGYNWMVEEGE